MKVDAKYYILTDDATLNTFQSQLNKGEKDDLYKILQNNKDPRQTQSIDYLVDNFKANGDSIDGKIKENIGKDKWVK